MKEIIPISIQGRFFGFRQRAAMGALILANACAAAWVSYSPRGYPIGYGVIGALAVAAGVASTWLLSRVPERTRRVSPIGLTSRPKLNWNDLKRVYSEPLRNSKFVRFLICAATMNGAIALAGPYFPYYFTKELGIPMDRISIWIILNCMGSFLASPFWGKKLDRSGDPRKLLFVSGLLIAFSPLPYVFRSAEVIRAIAPIEYFTNGIAWSGFTLGMNALLFRITPRGQNRVYFSLYSAAIGVSGAAFALLGGVLAPALGAWGGFRALWVVASLVRGSVVIFLFRSFLPTGGMLERIRTDGGRIS